MNRIIRIKADMIDTQDERVEALREEERYLRGQMSDLGDCDKSYTEINLEHELISGKLSGEIYKLSRMKIDVFYPFEWLSILIELFLDWIAPYDEKPKRKRKPVVWVDDDDNLRFAPGIKVEAIYPPDRERGTVHYKGKPKPERPATPPPQPTMYSEEYEK